MDKLRPELSPFCDYVRSFVLSATARLSEDDDLNWEFIAKELIIISSFYDLGDEVCFSLFFLFSKNSSNKGLLKYLNKIAVCAVQG